MKVATIGLDIAKHIFQVHGADAEGHPLLRRRLRRSQVAGFFANLPPCVVGMEACCGAHYWSRVIGRFGHTVRLIAPQFVKPYIKSNKNDAHDAEAICEAVSRPQMRFVAAKSVEQQDIQSLHRVRSRLVSSRTQLANQIRGLLTEYGIVLPQHISQLRRGLPLILEDASNELTAFSRRLFASLYDELLSLEEKIEAIDEQIWAVYQASESCQRLAAVEGIGPLIATALVAAMSDGKTFRNGRQFAAWLGLVPPAVFEWRESTTPRHQQAWRSLSTNSVDPWRSLRGIPRQPKDRSAESLDCRQATPIRDIESLRRGREQERPNRVVADRTRRGLPPRSIAKRFL
jgi:transposase